MSSSLPLRNRRFPPLHAALAALPPTLVALLLLRGIAPLRAAAAALVLSLLLVPFFAPIPSTLAPVLTATFATGAEVAAIMLAGITLYELLERADVHAQLGHWLTSQVREPARRVLLMALGVIPFIESMAGFGVGVIVGYPLLVRMGFAPRTAGLVALLAEVTVPWGAMGPGTLVASRLTGVPLQRLGEASAALSLPVFLVCGFTALTAAVGWRGAARKLGELILVAISLWGGIWLANRTVGTPAAGILGSPVAVVAVLLVARRAERFSRPSLTQAPFPGRALLPYGLLAGLLLASRWLGPPPAWLPAGAESLSTSSGALQPRLTPAGTVASMPGALPVPLGPGRGVAANAALWLAITGTCTAFGFRLSRQSVGEALRRSVGRWAPAALTTVAFLALGNLMRVSGMAAALAQLAAGAGSAYVALAPWVGGLGGFLTGTNAGANAMFAAAQAEAALRLGYPVDRMAALQNVSASLLTMGSPPRLALLASLAGNESNPAGLARPILLANVVVLLLLSGRAMLP